MNATSDALDPRAVIEQAAGPWGRDEKRPCWLRRAAHEIGLPVGVVNSLWYGKRKRLFHDEYLLLTHSAATIKERRDRLVALHAEVRAARDRVSPDVAFRTDQHMGRGD